MADNNNMTGAGKEPGSKMPYMCPMMYYGTYPVPMQDIVWPPPGIMYPGQGGCGGNMYNMYRPMPPFMYGGGYYNVPFPESGD